MGSEIEPFLGAWRLVSSEHRQDNGKITYPLGKNVEGLILYTADGYMSATLMDPRRPEFQSPELYAGTDQEKISAMTGFLSYAGRFEVRDEFVIHHVELSLFPNWIGTAQQRYFRFFDKDKLELRTNPFSADGIRQTAYLVWERAPTL